MTRKEFNETVDFRFALNEWATSQPSYTPSIAEADVEQVMVKLRPSLKSRHKSPDPAKLKYQIMVQSIALESPKPKPPISIEVRVMNQSQIEQELLKTGLLEMVNDKIRATELGRRWVLDYERETKTGE